MRERGLDLSGFGKTPGADSCQRGNGTLRSRTARRVRASRPTDNSDSERERETTISNSLFCRKMAGLIKH
jgi:hypothetical protein